MSARGREVLERYRAATGLRPADRARVLRSLQARLAAGELPPVDAPVPALPPVPGIQRLVRARWLLIAALAVFGVGPGMWLLASDASRSPQPSAAAAGGPGLEPPLEVSQVPLTAQPAAASAMTADETPVAAPPPRRKAARLASQPMAASPIQARLAPEPPAAAEVTPLPSERAELSPAAPSTAPRRIETSPASPSAPPEHTRPEPSRDALAEEMEVLDAAQAASRAGDTRRALALLAEHAWRFPDGHLAEARDVARILALCQAGHVVRSRAQGQRFLAERPHSPFAARVRASCP